MKTRKLHWLNDDRLRLHGEYGNALAQIVKNRLYKIDYRLLVDPFRFRDECDRAWRCEFWGKNLRGAILIWHLTKDVRLEQLIRDTVEDMLSTRRPDGSITSYPEELQLNDWDIWGRKYTMLGLLRYYDLMGHDPRIPGIVAGMADHLRRQLQECGKELRNCGWHTGMAASSILGAIVNIYRVTGEKRFLDWAGEIVSSGASEKHNIFLSALNGIPPKETGNGKAYEMMSCFQGLTALQQFCPDDTWLEICTRFYQQIRDRELFITGAAGLKDSCGEFWNDGTEQQTEIDPQKTGAFGETCITATWLHYCNELLALTGDAEISATLESSVYNAVPGSADFTTGRWIHQNPTPLAAPADKIPCTDQIQRGFGKPFGGNDCCLAQGPESVAMAAVMSVLQDDSGAAYLNFYLPLETSCFRLSGSYPFGGSEMVLEFTEDFDRPLYLRAAPGLYKAAGPAGELAFEPNTWFPAGKSFRRGHRISLQFDLQVRARYRNGRVVLTAGPVVLAQDSRLGNVGTPLRGDLDFHRISARRDRFCTIYENRSGQKLCDYGSAGNLLSPANTLQVWLEP